MAKLSKIFLIQTNGNAEQPHLKFQLQENRMLEKKKS